MTTEERLAGELAHVKALHEALGVKISSLERHLDPNHEDDIYDAVSEARADEVLNQSPVMQRNINMCYDSPGLDLEPLAPSIKALNQAAEYMRKAPAAARDWEVLEFRPTGKNELFTEPYLLSDNGLYNQTCKTGNWGLEDMLHDIDGSVASGEFYIHRVRRLSDGVEFAVGDKCIDAFGDEIVIGSFEIGENIMMVCGSNSRSRLESIEHIKKPLFTTADGVALYENHDLVYCYQKSDGGVLSWSLANIKRDTSKCEYYSTEAAALDAYKAWLYGQRVLSMDDVFKYLELSSETKDLDELVKQRVK